MWCGLVIYTLDCSSKEMLPFTSHVKGHKEDSNHSLGIKKLKIPVPINTLNLNPHPTTARQFVKHDSKTVTNLSHHKSLALHGWYDCLIAWFVRHALVTGRRVAASPPHSAWLVWYPPQRQQPAASSAYLINQGAYKFRAQIFELGLTIPLEQMVTKFILALPVAGATERNYQIPRYQRV